MPEARVFEPDYVVWAVPELGICQLRAPTGAVERVLSSYYADPGADAAALSTRS